MLNNNNQNNKNKFKIPEKIGVIVWKKIIRI